MVDQGVPLLREVFDLKVHEGVGRYGKRECHEYEIVSRVCLILEKQKVQQLSEGDTRGKFDLRFSEMGGPESRSFGVVKRSFGFKPKGPPSLDIGFGEPLVEGSNGRRGSSDRGRDGTGDEERVVPSPYPVPEKEYASVNPWRPRPPRALPLC